MADPISGRHQVRLSYRQASEIAWSISWPTGVLYFGSQLVLRLIANSASPGVSAEMFEALSDFLRLLLLGFFPMIVRRAADAAFGSAVVSPSDPAGVNVAGVKKHRGRCDSRTRRRLGHDLPVAVLAGVVGPIRAALRAPGLAH